MPAVWITRAGEAGERTADVLAARGYDSIHAPLIEVTYPPCPEPLDALPAPDWLVLVSANALEGFVRALGDRIDALRRSPGLRVAAVGNRTAEAARRAGFAGVHVPEVQRAEGIVVLLDAAGLAGRVVWIPSGDQEGSATRVLPAALGARGADVRILPVYAVEERRPAAAERARLTGARPGAVILHSPSAARALRAAIDDDPALAPWAEAEMIAIGPVTAHELGRLGWPSPRAAADPSDAGLLDILDAIVAPRR